MICPKCGADDMQKVLSTRKPKSDFVLRRRECSCGYRFSSVEIAELNETTMKAIERVMGKNSKPRSFEKIIHETYRSIFDRYQWMKERRGLSDS